MNMGACFPAVIISINVLILSLFLSGLCTVFSRQSVSMWPVSNHLWFRSLNPYSSLSWVVLYQIGRVVVYKWHFGRLKCNDFTLPSFSCWQHSFIFKSILGLFLFVYLITSRISSPSVHSLQSPEHFWSTLSNPRAHLHSCNKMHSWQVYPFLINTLPMMDISRPYTCLALIFEQQSGGVLRWIPLWKFWFICWFSMFCWSSIITIIDFVSTWTCFLIFVMTCSFLRALF